MESKDPNIIIYKASAGSGKTYNLALNYLKFISQEGKDSLKKFLAITFTNKAAFEMKQRIIVFLKEIIKQTERGKTLSSQLNLPSEKAEEILNHLFLNYDYLQVKTIDSFLLTLYKAISYEVGLEPDFRVNTYLREELIEKALVDFYQQTEKDQALRNVLETFVEILITEKESLKLNFKNSLISELKKLLEKLTYHKEVLTLLNSLNKDDDNELDREIKTYFGFYSVLKNFLERTFFREKELVIGLWKEKIADILFKEDGLLPWVYVKLGSLRGVIIDEFQDTDRLQWEALSPIVEDLISKQGFLICAGDPKQSIFQWRGADPKLFEEVLQNLSLRSYKVKEEVLDRNYRSSKTIIEFNNRFFSKLNEIFSKLNEDPITHELLTELVFSKSDKGEEKDKVLQKLVNEFKTNFRHVLQNPSNIQQREDKSRVKIRRFNIDESSEDKAIEKTKEEVLKILNELKSQGELKDVAILMLKNEEVADFSSFLISQGFNVLATSSLHLKESLVVNALVSLLKFIAYPEDEVALAGFLSSAIFPEGKKILEEYLNWILTKFYLSIGAFLKEHKKEFWETQILPLLDLKKDASLYKICIEIFKNLEIEKKFSTEIAALSKFLTMVFNLDRKGDGLEEFLLYWEKDSEDEMDALEVEDCIKILTIHKAKGLEFETVILPLIWKEKRFVTDLKLVFYNGKVFYGKKDDLPEEGKLGWYLEKAKNRLELLNLLYVALTRAKKNLFVLLPDPIEKTKFSPLVKIFKKVYDLLESENLESSNSLSSSKLST
ncbi:UvrD-helicase domain-containing protein [Thermodesulfobacterium hveragerdense]|uniref:UvrD-helicase domain-containing protein n=1 Tax=Thermodesulfobacterium hveragerdense TaxID=53424 RepID=UPI000418CC33|nr:UvrD-helicase domain-containing protein [Thermodesulfobacterium hveragerdense]